MTLDFADTQIVNALIGRRALDIPDSVRTRGRSSDAFSCGHMGENRDVVAFWTGAPISAHPVSGALLARAEAPYHRCFGLGQLGARVGDSEVVQWEGVFEMRDWTRVAGTEMLVCSAIYYLGIAPGTITLTAPCVPGQLVQRIGQAMSSVELQLNLGEPVLL